VRISGLPPQQGQRVERSGKRARWDGRPRLGIQNNSDPLQGLGGRCVAGLVGRNAIDGGASEAGGILLPDMRRRELITLVACALTTWPIVARAQQTSVPVVGVLSSQSQASEAALLAEWRQALNETGYVDGRNVTFEYRFADGQGDRLPTLAADLVRRQVAVLVANTYPSGVRGHGGDRDDPNRVHDRGRPGRGGPGRDLQPAGRKPHRRDLPVQQARG
jgi:hypothetical protein